MDGARAARGRAACVIGQGSAVTLDGRFDAALERQPHAVRQLAAAPRTTPRGGSRAAQYMLFDQAIREVREPGTCAVPPRSCCPKGARRSRRYLAGGRVVFYVERAVGHPPGRRVREAHGMKPVIAGGAEAWVVAARARGRRACR